jgi:hypothetical protein
MNTKLGFSYLFALALLLGMALNAGAFQGFTAYTIEEQNSLQQTGSSSFIPGTGGFGGDGDQFSLVAQVDTGGANLSAAPILGLPAPTIDIPSGSITFPTGPNFSPTFATGNGYNRYQYGLGWTSTALLNSEYGSGTFTFTLGNATATPTLSLNIVSPTFPISPTLTSGGTWSGGHLLVDPTAGATLTFNSSAFTGYTSGLGGEITFELVDFNHMPISPPATSFNVPSLGKTDPALTSYTIAPGALVAGQTYNFQANYRQFDGINTTSFTGTGITGNPVGVSVYVTSTFITIDAVVGAPTPTRVDGSGTIIALSGGQMGPVNFTIQVGITKNKKGKSKITGSASYNGISAKKITSLTINGNDASFSGTAKIPKTSVARAQKVSFTIDVTGNGNPGTNDTFAIGISNGYSASGNLTSGNILIH